MESSSDDNTASDVSQRLLPHHLEHLQESGLSDDTIKRAAIYSVDSPWVATQLGFPHLTKNLPAIAFPLLLPNRNGASPDPNQVRLRPDKPRLDNDLRPVKYETKKATANRLYVPDLADSALKDPATPLYFTEGEKKALKACQEGLPTIALAGVWSWLTKQGEESQPLPDLDEINLKEREVFLVFDSDIVEKPEVQWAEYHFAQELESRGARVSAICLPEGKGGTKVGLDDYLVNYSIEEFHKLPKVTIKKPTPLPDATQPIILHPALEVTPNLALIGFRHQKVVSEQIKEDNIFFVATSSGMGMTNRPTIDLGTDKAVLDVKGRLLPLAGGKLDLDNLLLWLRNPASPDAHNLYVLIKDKIRAYIYSPEPAYGLVAAWVMGTYFFYAFPAYPFLNPLGPKETGKTNLLFILAQLCFNAVRTTYITAPALADTTDALRGTLLLDQADNLDRNPELLAILVDSYKKEGGRRRVVTLTKTSRKVEEFDSYGPKAFASKKTLPEDIVDRCFTINMSPAPCPYADPAAAMENWKVIRTQLYKLLLTSYSQVSSLISGGLKEPSRFGELWQPVYVILSLVNAEVDEVESIRHYCVEKFNLVKSELDDWHQALVEVVLEAPVTIFNKTLLDMLLDKLELKDAEVKPGTTWLGKELRALGLLKESRRVHGGQEYILNKEHAERCMTSQNTYTTYTPDTDQIVQDRVQVDETVQVEDAQPNHPAQQPTLSEPDTSVQDDRLFQRPLHTAEPMPVAEELSASFNKDLFPAQYLGSLCYFALDDDWAKLAPEGYLVYTLAEAEVLGQCDERTKRLVHEAKKLAGAKVVGWSRRDNDSQEKKEEARGN